jgi:hypothetical protein
MDWARMLAYITGTLQQGMQQVQATLHPERRRQITAQLDAALPGSRAQNNDNGFLRWLSEKDQFAGTSRQQLLTQVWQSWAVDRVNRDLQGLHQGANAAPIRSVPGPATRR